jgi:hypothetical protein
MLLTFAGRFLTLRLHPGARGAGHVRVLEQARAGDLHRHRARRPGRAGTLTRYLVTLHVILQLKRRVMTACMVHVQAATREWDTSW